MALFYYTVCVTVSLILYLWLYLTDVRRSVCQNVMLLVMTITNAGYLAFGAARNLNEAILANKIVYFGGFILPMLYFFTVCEICHVKLGNLLKTILVFIQITCFSFACTIGYSSLYYKSVEHIVENGVSYLEKTYGPLHFLYPFTMYGYFAVSISVAVFSAIKKKNVNNKDIFKLLSFGGVAAVFYMLQRYMANGIQLMPASDIILIVGAILPIYNSSLYDAEQNKDVINEQLESIGFITFNRRLEYMGCDDFSRFVFDELEDFEVGKRIFPKDSELKKLNNSFKEYVTQAEEEKIKGHVDTKLVTINIADRFYESEVHTLEDYFGNCAGFIIVLKDETEHYKMMELTEKYNDELTKQVKEKTKQIRTIQEKTILGMAQMVESRDLSTGGHIKRTSDVVRIFSQKLLLADMNLDNGYLELVVRSAPMHDLGKIGVSDAILTKQAKFTDEEYEIMKKHAEIGGKMVEDILSGVEEEEFVRIAHNVANYHHEKVNGKGYPEGLKGDEIPLEARIMALADVFDALVSKRCYKDAFSYDRAFSIIEEDAGSHFDKELATIFLSCRSELEQYYNNCEH